MINQHRFSADSFPSTEDGVACCRVCHCPMFYLESINIGSRGEVFSGGRICRNQRDCQWLCNDKTDKEKREDACLECENDVKVKRKKSILWIICLSMCILCGFISIISFGIYFSEGSNYSQGNLEEYQNNLGGGSKEFKKFKKFITSILK